MKPQTFIDTVKNFIVLNKQKIKYTILAILFIEIVWLTILVTTRKPKMPVQDKARLDSVYDATKKLEEQQKVYDKAIFYQDQYLNDLRNQVDTIKGRTVVVKEYYHDVITKINNYSESELDSFFRQRYKY